MEAVILAGGQGTRLRPLTDTIPKPLLPFMGEPYAVGLLRRLRDVGVTDATFLVGCDSGPWAPLSAMVAEVRMGVAVVTEPAPLDTAGAARALLSGERRPAGDVLVCNGDILTDLDLGELMAAHRAAGAIATIALTRVEDTSAFGVVVTGTDGRVERFVEKPPPGTLEADTVNAGTYVLGAKVFESFPGNGPLSFERDVFPGLLADGATVLGRVGDAFWADLGTPARYLAGHKAVLGRRCAWPVAPGMSPPVALVSVHETARIAASAQLGPGTVVGADCEVAAGAALRDSVLHEGVRVGAGAVVEQSILGAGCDVPDGAYVAEGSVLVAEV